MTEAIQNDKGFKCMECGETFLFKDYDEIHEPLNKANVHIRTNHDGQGEIKLLTSLWFRSGT